MPGTWDSVGFNQDYLTLYHEYGHHLLYNLAESPFPDYDNENCDGILIEIGPIVIPELGHCQWLSEEGVTAWTEGFPTFLAYVLHAEIYGSNDLIDQWLTYNRDDDSYVARGIETPALFESTRDGTELFQLIDSNGNEIGLYEPHPDNDYEHVEGFTAAVLWDLYDSRVDDHDRDQRRDTASLSFYDIWEVVSEYDPDPADPDHNHPTSLAEFYDGARDLLAGRISQARLAGPFVENHIDVPMINLEVNGSSFTTYQDWDLTQRYGRGDVLPANYKVCRPLGGMAWEGEVEVGIRQSQPASDFRRNTPPLLLPDVTEGDCAQGVYEYLVPADYRLPGPLFVIDRIFDNGVTFDTLVCVDHRNQLAESDETDNCSNSEVMRLWNRPPIVDTNGLGSQVELDEGSNLVIDLTGSYDPDPIIGDELRYRVIVPDEFDSGWVESPVFNLTSADNEFLRDGETPAVERTLQIIVRDIPEDEDITWASDTLIEIPLTVKNVEPWLAFTNLPTIGYFHISEGTELTIEGLFADPGDFNDWTASGFFFDTSEWVDGEISDVFYSTSVVPNQYQGDWSITRTFTQDTVRTDDDFFVCVDDGDEQGCTTIGGARVIVVNVPPEVNIPAQINGDEGDTVNIGGTVTDPGEDSWTGTASIDGGTPFEITIESDRTFSVPIEFPQDGTFNVEVCAHDGIAQDCSSTSVQIDNVAPNFTFPVVNPFSEGSNLNFSTSFTDPGADTWSATVAYDGATPVALALTGMTFVVDRTYPQDGSYFAEVCVSDDDATTCKTINFTVQNVAPTVLIESVPEKFIVLVGDALVATFFDPGTQDTHTATIDWGDGSIDPASVSPHATETGQVSENHAYYDAGDFTVEVCVTDDDESGCTTIGVRVATPEEALADAIDDLSAQADTDPAVADALVELSGGPSPSMSGVFDKIESNDLVAAIEKIRKTIEDLDDSVSDQSDVQLLLAQIAESIARDQLAAVEALGLTANGDLKKLGRLQTNINDGRAALLIGDYEGAASLFKSAVQKTESLL